MKKLLYTPSEVMIIFRISRSTFDTWCDNGILKKITIPGQRRIYATAESVERLVSGDAIARQEPPKPAAPKLITKIIKASPSRPLLVSYHIPDAMNICIQCGQPIREYIEGMGRQMCLSGLSPFIQEVSAKLTQNRIDAWKSYGSNNVRDLWNRVFKRLRDNHKTRRVLTDAYYWRFKHREEHVSCCSTIKPTSTGFIRTQMEYHGQAG